MWILGVGIGGLITYLVSKRFYVKAAIDLKEATDDLKKKTSLLARLLEGQGVPCYNEKGELIGVSVTIAVNVIEGTIGVGEGGGIAVK